MWADVIQCIIMLGVILIVIIKGTIDIGGFSTIWQRLVIGNRSEIIIWSSSPYSHYSLWTMVVGASIHYTSHLTINQSLMQRYSSNKCLKNAQISMAGGCLGMAIGHFLTVFCGLIMYAFFYLCDPLLDGQVAKGDQLMALFAVETLSFIQGLPGVFIAGILCATLSTLSSILNSLSAVTLSDYIKPLKPDLSDATTLRLSKLLVVFYGGLCISLVALVEKMEGVLKAAFSIAGLTGGPVLTLYTIGMLFPWADSKIALIAFGFSAIVPWFASFGNFFTSPPKNHAPFSIEGCVNATYNFTILKENLELSGLQQFYALHSFWYASWSLVTGLLVALLLLKVIGTQDPKNVSSELLFPFMQKYGAIPSNFKQETIDLKVLGKESTTKPLLISKPEQNSN